MVMVSNGRSAGGATRPRGNVRWWAAGAGLLAACLDVFGATRAGVTFALGEGDVTLWVLLYLSLNFAALGFLAGYVIDLRRRDRHTATLVETQMRAINAAQARLAQSEKLAAIGQLAATVAHEVRNPLAVIRSAAQEVTERLAAGDAEGRRSCSFITAEIDRLTNVTSSLLALARPLRLERRPVSVAELVERALLLARGTARTRQVEVRHRVPPALPAVDADPDLVCQVLIDVVTNAAEAVTNADGAPARPDGGNAGEITMEAHARADAVDIVVADTGPGVPPDLRARIFEPFFTTRAGGTGLGLAVARQIVLAHGGRICVDEQPGGGARFTITLPRAAAAPAAA
jgi:signal transduction histidine kinase